MEIIRSAPGKVILCGEHSVVYGYPAIAVPVSGIRALARIESQKENRGLQIAAPDIQQHFSLVDAQKEHPIAMTARMVLDTMGCAEPNVLLTVESQLPIAAGMGSGAAVTVAIIRALSAYLGKEFNNATINRMTFKVEKFYHGTPSGIDNTVITWERPTYFIKGNPPNFCAIGAPIYLLIASSGITALTRKAINHVRSLKTGDPHYYSDIFNRIGDLTNASKKAIAAGDTLSLGTFLNDNHELLVDLGVSIPILDAMVNSAQQAGALGAKLTGSGLGGNIIALVDENHIVSVKEALYRAGSTHVWKTVIVDGKYQTLPTSSTQMGCAS